MLPILAAAAFLSPSTPKTFEDLELDEISAVHQIKTFRSESEMEIFGDKGAKTTFRWNYLIDGDRLHLTVKLAGGKNYEFIETPTFNWGISDRDKTYGEFKNDPAPAFNPKDEIFHSDDGFKFEMISEHSPATRFASDTAFSLQSIETVQLDHRTLRKAVATTVSKHGNKGTLTQWFLPDRWILVKAEMVAHVATGDQKLLELNVSKIDLQTKITDADFALNPARVAGYQKSEQALALELDDSGAAQPTTHLDIGLQLPADVTLQTATLATTDPEKNSIGEIYYSKTRKVGVMLARAPMPEPSKDDQATETELADLIFRDINPTQGAFQSMRYKMVSGWPTLEADVNPKAGEKFTLGGAPSQADADTGVLHFRVFRVKNALYEAIFFGPWPVDERAKLLQSLTLPKDVGTGDRKVWPPEPITQSLENSTVELWTPVPLKLSPESTDDSKMYSADMGYTQVALWVKDWNVDSGTGPEADKALEDWLHATILSRTEEKEKVTFGDVQSYTAGDDLFHFITYRDATIDGRIDVVKKHGKIYVFYLAVPGGMLDSDEIKHVIKSYSVG